MHPCEASWTRWKEWAGLEEAQIRRARLASLACDSHAESSPASTAGLFLYRALAGAAAPPPEKNIESILLEIRLCSELTSLAFIHCSGLRKLNNFCSIVTLGPETKRANTQPDGGI